MNNRVVRRSSSSLLVACCLALTACSFSPHADSPDAGSNIDGPPSALPAISFVSTSQTVDHESGAITVAVQITGTVGAPATVAFSASGDAMLGTDYSFTPGTLTFSTGQGQTIPLTILPVSQVTTDHHIILSLSDPTGATLGANTMFDIDISPEILPRVSFATPMSQVTEGNVTHNVEVDLDKTSTFDVTVTFGVDMTSTAQSPANFTVPTMVTIPAGMMSAQLGVGIVDDNSFDGNLSAVLDISGATAAELAPANTTHTVIILENDAEPVVAFQAATQNVNESTGSATIVVTVTGATSLPITVPFGNVAGSTTADPASFSYKTASPLTIAPGTTTANIQIQLSGDTDCIDNNIGTAIDPSNLGNATAGATTANTLTVKDDTGALVGPGAADPFEVCLDPKPAASLTLSGPIDTDSLTQCLATQPFGWTSTQGQADACFVTGTDVTLAGVTASGSRPLVIAATGTISVTTLDVSSHAAVSGRIGLPPTGSFQRLHRVPAEPAGQQRQRRRRRCRRQLHVRGRQRRQGRQHQPQGRRRAPGHHARADDAAARLRRPVRRQRSARTRPARRGAAVARSTSSHRRSRSTARSSTRRAPARVAARST